MEYGNIKNLKQAGFEGFVPVKDLLAGKTDVIPAQPGVYMVVTPDNFDHSFLEVGTGGYFKGRNPNVQQSVLEASWVPDTCVLYIGKAGGGTSSATLRKRIGQYLRFGTGEPVGHWGGRFIWQLKYAESLLFCWKSTDRAREDEAALISDFKAQHSGRRPFANLKD